MSAAADQGSVLRTLAAALAGITLDVVGARVATAARERIFDTLGAACLGFETPEGRQMRAIDAQLRALGGPRHALDRCRLLVGAARSTETDDIDCASCTTVGSVVVPAALALAAADPRADERTLLASVVAGYEAMVRLGRAIGGATLIYRGVWPTYVTAAFGAAAAAARLLDLDAEQTACALGLALARTGVPQQAALAHPGFRYFALGGAAAEGCVAALAARAGVGADEGELAAFGERVGADIDDAALVADLGGSWRIREVDTKTFPSARQAVASVEAFLELAPFPRPPDEIERIVVTVPSAYRGMIDRPVPPALRIESLLGAQYQIALAALDPAALYDALRPKLQSDARTVALMARVEIRADVDLDKRFPRIWGSAVTLHWRSGEVARAEVLEPRGSGARELRLDALRSKAERIYAASGLERGSFLPELYAGCASLGQGVSARGGAARLLELLDALACTEPAPRSARVRSGAP